MRTKLTICGLLLTLLSLSQAQDGRLDSLESVLRQASTPEERAVANNALAEATAIDATSNLCNTAGRPGAWPANINCRTKKPTP